MALIFHFSREYSNRNWHPVLTPVMVASMAFKPKLKRRQGRKMSEEPAEDAKTRMPRSSMEAKIHIHRSLASRARPVCGPDTVPPRIPLLLRLSPLPTENRTSVVVEPGKRGLLAAVILFSCRGLPNVLCRRLICVSQRLERALNLFVLLE